MHMSTVRYKKRGTLVYAVQYDEGNQNRVKRTDTPGERVVFAPMSIGSHIVGVGRISYRILIMVSEIGAEEDAILQADLASLIGQLARRGRR